MNKLKIAIYSLLVFAAAFCFSTTAFAFPPDKEKGANCASCHKLEAQEAAKLIKADAFGAKVISVKSSESVKGIWEVELELRDSRKITVYVDYSKKFLIEARLTQLENLGRPPKVDYSSIPTKDALLIGKKKAKHKIIMWSDPDCPYCKKFHEVAKEIVKKRSDISFLVKLFPLPSHPDAARKSKAIVCKNSLSMLEDAYAGKSIPEPSCDTKIIDENIELGRKLNIGGTPTIVLPEGSIVPGLASADDFIKVFDIFMTPGGSIEEALAIMSKSPAPQPEQKEPQAQGFRKIDYSSIPVKDGLLLGKEDAKYKVIVFDDPDCPFCKKFHPEAKAIVAARPDIAFLIKMYPLVELHPNAYAKSKAIVCTKTMEILEDAFAGKTLPPASCETSIVDETIALAARYGITGTPTLVFPNGTVIPGYLPSTEFIKLFDEQMKK